MSECWMNFPHGQAPCFVQLGRFGDIILLLPAFKAIYDRIGMKPKVIVSTQYKSVLEGVTYVEPIPVDYEWWRGMPKAREMAEQMFGGAVVPQFWNDPGHDDIAERSFQDGGIVLQCHGMQWGVDISRWPNYMTSMWYRAGFSPEEMRSLPLVFDNRSQVREAALVKRVRGLNTKPMLLVNFQGNSSPFGPVPEVMATLDPFRKDILIVDMGRITAERIYDLLGLYDNAIGLITSDTSTLHLAATGTIPYICYTVDGWTSSVPKGKVALEIKYNDALNRLNAIEPIVRSWIYDLPPIQPVHAEESRSPAPTPDSPIDMGQTALERVAG